VGKINKKIRHYQKITSQSARIVGLVIFFMCLSTEISEGMLLDEHTFLLVNDKECYLNV
jgi:hypothetical protein